ncbi:hypothetical protein [Treponema sp.]|uniref:right-handed parallel beta-helix repeat-containing protein n=1 Tax=Treponema sp. TaxID=166 RepID=UPI0025DD657A|nr:hypothetical protein [Treponema sp.]MBR4321503.1 hypothetical protein [Treponema sp.]
MKITAIKKFFAMMAFSAFILAGCSVDSGDSASGSQPSSVETPGKTEPVKPENPSDENKTVSGVDVETESETVSDSIVWAFSDLGSFSIKGVDADTKIDDASSLASASVVYQTFSSAAEKKYSLKADLDYPSSDKRLTAKIKALGSDGHTPIQYNKYESSATCKVNGASKGGLQLYDDAFVINGVEGPFSVTINYGANSSKAKTDGRYGYIKIDGREYDDESVKSAKSLSSNGVSFTARYDGNQTVDVIVGAGLDLPSPCWIRLYDVIISREDIHTTTVTTTTYSDGSKKIVTEVKDSSGKLVSSKTETKNAPSSSNSGSSEPSVLPDPTDSEEYKNGSKIGSRSRLSEIDTATITNAIHVSTAQELEAAITGVQEGGAIILAAGIYSFDHQLNIKYGNNGSASGLKYIMPEKGAKVTLDFSSQSYDKDTSKNARGLQIEGDYWHVYGLTVYGAADNGIFVCGKHNIVERCVLQANRDTGLQISRRSSSISNFDEWPSDNLILNCTSFDNHDPATDENADGFAAKLTCGNGNVFDGCIAYCNSDDGWDLYAKSATGSIGVVTIKNCVAFGNGKLTAGSSFANGDMNGFKLGGSNNAVPTPHVVYNSMAFGNGKDGFTDNGNGGALQIYNCTSFGNQNSNFNFYRTYAGGLFKRLVSMLGSVSPEQVDKFGGKAKECSVAAKISDSVFVLDKSKKIFSLIKEETEIFNGSKLGENVSDPYSNEIVSATAPVADASVDSACRNEDGTINMKGFLEIKEGSAYDGMGAKFGSEAYQILPVTLK